MQFGQLPFFIQFLKVAGLFDAYIADCPRTYASPSAPSKRDVLGTVLLSVLAGQKRYAHITALRAGDVLSKLVGLSRVLSEDAVCRGSHLIAAAALKMALDKD